MWWVWALGRVLIGFGAITIVQKRSTQIIQAPARALAWQMSLSLVFWSTLYASTVPSPWTPDPRMIPIACLGCLGIFASYCYWHAVRLSVSKTALLGQGDDLIAYGIAFLFLGETGYVNQWLVVGTLLSIVAGIAFMILRRQADHAPILTLLKWAAFPIVVWGITLPCTRYFAKSDMPLATYTTAWYVGAYAGALAMRYRFKSGEGRTPFSRHQFSLIALHTLLSIITAAAHYLSKRTAPMVVVQPIYQMAELTIPPLIGLWYFKEGKHLRPRDIAILCVAAVGVLIIASSYQM